MTLIATTRIHPSRQLVWPFCPIMPGFSDIKQLFKGVLSSDQGNSQSSSIVVTGDHGCKKHGEGKGKVEISFYGKKSEATNCSYYSDQDLASPPKKKQREDSECNTDPPTPGMITFSPLQAESPNARNERVLLEAVEAQIANDAAMARRKQKNDNGAGGEIVDHKS